MQFGSEVQSMDLYSLGCFVVNGGSTRKARAVPTAAHIKGRAIHHANAKPKNIWLEVHF